VNKNSQGKKGETTKRGRAKEPQKEETSAEKHGETER
jgi:hypothetical protein